MVLASHMSHCCQFQVVQVYLAWNRAALPVPRWMLVGFSRITIPEHSSRQEHFVITARQMSVWLNDTVGFDILQGTALHTCTVLQYCDIGLLMVGWLVNAHEPLIS